MRQVRESVVVAVPSGDFDGVTLCCSFVPDGEPAISATELRSELGRWLPAYMIPSRWRTHGELPRNATGKVDRKRLREIWLAEVEKEEMDARKSAAS